MIEKIDKIIDDFVSDFPKGYLKRPEGKKSSSMFVDIKDGGFFANNLRVSKLKGTLKRCEFEKISDKEIKTILPLVEYTDLLLYYKEKYADNLADRRKK